MIIELKSCNSSSFVGFSPRVGCTDNEGEVEERCPMCHEYRGEDEDAFVNFSVETKPPVDHTKRTVRIVTT